MLRALVAASVLVTASPAVAEPLPPGAIGLQFGALSGTGADAKRIGAGYYPFGLAAAWQPMSTEQRWNWSLRWATMFGRLYGGNAAQLDSSLQTVQMDVMAGVRYRPWTTPSRYLTLRGGAELLRSNEPIPPKEQRSFVGGVASIGLDQYVGGFLFDVDVRYGLIGSGPGQLALLVGFAVAGP